MTKDEALRLAIKSLCCVRDMVKHPDNLEYIDHQVAKIEAALEAKDEPVAIFKEDLDGGYVDLLAVQGQPLSDNTFLYTTPPQRTWVGLTDDELFKIWMGAPAETEDRFAFVNAVISKLKEKNT